MEVEDEEYLKHRPVLVGQPLSRNSLGVLESSTSFSSQEDEMQEKASHCYISHKNHEKNEDEKQKSGLFFFRNNTSERESSASSSSSYLLTRGVNNDDDSSCFSFLGLLLYTLIAKPPALLSYIDRSQYYLHDDLFSILETSDVVEIVKNKTAAQQEHDFRIWCNVLEDIQQSASNYYNLYFFQHGDTLEETQNIHELMINSECVTKAAYGNVNLVVVFPFHKDVNKKVLFTGIYTTQYELNEEIQTRLDDCAQGSPQICFFYGSKVLCLDGITLGSDLIYLVQSSVTRTLLTQQQRHDFVYDHPVFFVFVRSGLEEENFCMKWCALLRDEPWNLPVRSIIQPLLGSRVRLLYEISSFIFLLGLKKRKTQNNNNIVESNQQERGYNGSGGKMFTPVAANQSIVISRENTVTEKEFLVSEKSTIFFTSDDEEEEFSSLSE